ncbi:DUF4446 family protein [Patescibacteria group bacterium]|nr:DUF4446 family protein [Patescibacteria group bacterium]
MNIKLTSISLVFFVLAGIAFIFTVIGTIWMVKTEKRLKRFFLGKTAKDLEDNLVALEDNIVKLNAAKEKTEKELVVVNQKLKKSIRGLETLRFNPFPDQGSNQSFAIGLLNEDGDGVVLSSLYARERMSVFAKPVKGGKSEYELSDEEKDVLSKAIVK